MRLFVAAVLPPEIIGSLQSVRRILGPRFPGARWVDFSGAHVTLKFIGETPDGARPALESAIASAAAGFRPFAAEAAGLGVFPGPRKPAVLWAGVRRGATELAACAAAMEAALVSAGAPREERPFRPHVTLARFAAGFRLPEPPWPPALNEEVFGEFPVDAVALMRSQSKSGGSLYTVLRTFALKPGSPA